jgi:hypothetical protein
MFQFGNGMNEAIRIALDIANSNSCRLHPTPDRADYHVKGLAYNHGYHVTDFTIAVLSRIKIFPCKRFATLERAYRAAADNLRKIFGRQAQARTDAAHIVRRQLTARRDVFYDIKRAAEHSVASLGVAPGIVNTAEGEPGIATIVDKVLELVRLEAESGIRPTIRAPQGEMLLYHASAECYRGNRAGRPRSVIR